MSVVDINLPWNCHYMTLKTILFFTWLSIYWNISIQSWKFGQILLALWKNVLRKSDYLQEFEERNENRIAKWGHRLSNFPASTSNTAEIVRNRLNTENWMVSLESFTELRHYLSLCSAWWRTSDKKALWTQVQGTLFTLHNEAQISNTFRYLLTSNVLGLGLFCFVLFFTGTQGYFLYVYSKFTFMSLLYRFHCFCKQA